MERRLSTHSARIDMIQCMYVKKIEGNSHIFGGFLDNIKKAVECLLNSKTLTLMSNCSIILEEDDKPNAYYNLDNWNIHISTGLLEYLWCLAYFHYDVYARTPWGNPEIDFDVSKNPYEIQYTEESIAVLNHLKHIHNENFDKKWEEIVSKISSNYDINDGTPISLASELMLHSIVVIILHELAHRVVHLNGINLPDLAEEKVADWFAYTQFFKLPSHMVLDSRKYNNAMGKRFVACINAGSFLYVTNLTQPHGAIHPDGISRLDSIIKHNSNFLDLVDDTLYDPKDDIYDMRKVLSYATVILCMHAQLWIEDNEYFCGRVHKILTTKVFESPFYVYKELKDCLSEYFEWKENTFNDEAFNRGTKCINALFSLL